jgi:hypothetical protein
MFPSSLIHPAEDSLTRGNHHQNGRNAECHWVAAVLAKTGHCSEIGRNECADQGPAVDGEVEDGEEGGNHLKMN